MDFLKGNIKIHDGEGKAMMKPAKVKGRGISAGKMRRAFLFGKAL
jgi:hypothetical protein